MVGWGLDRLIIPDRPVLTLVRDGIGGDVPIIQRVDELSGMSSLCW